MKKITNSIILILMLVASVNSLAFASEDSDEVFGAFVFTPSTADGTIEGYELEGSGMLGFIYGNKKMFSENLGLYGSYDMSYNSVDETETSDKTIYGYRIFNIGLTYSPSDSIRILGGIGMSWEYGEFFYNGTHYESEEDKTQMNFHAGMAYNITDKYGVILTYNTASSSIGGGFTFNF